MQELEHHLQELVNQKIIIPKKRPSTPKTRRSFCVGGKDAPPKNPLSREPHEESPARPDPDADGGGFRGADPEGAASPEVPRRETRSHLLDYRFVTEDQMVRALAEQFAVGGIRLSGCEIPEDVAKRIPVKIAEDHVAVPFRFDREKGELHVAIADPGDVEALSLLRRASGAPRVVLYIAPESRIRSKIASLYHGRADASSRDQVIDLPDLFADEKEKRPARSAEAKETGEKAPPRAGILLFTGQLFLKNVLPSIFEREEVRLSVATSADQIVEALKATECDRVLVSEDVREGSSGSSRAPAPASPFRKRRISGPWETPSSRTLSLTKRCSNPCWRRSGASPGRARPVPAGRRRTR